MRKLSKNTVFALGTAILCLLLCMPAYASTVVLDAQNLSYSGLSTLVSEDTLTAAELVPFYNTSQKVYFGVTTNSSGVVKRLADDTADNCIKIMSGKTYSLNVECPAGSTISVLFTNGGGNTTTCKGEILNPSNGVIATNTTVRKVRLKRSGAITMSGTASTSGTYRIVCSNADMCLFRVEVTPPSGQTVTYVKGDANGDNSVTNADVAVMLKKVNNSSYVMGLQNKTTDYMTYVDLDSDSKITLKDAIAVAKLVK